MTGPAIGRPKSATFRTMDIAGLDILAHVAKNLRRGRRPGERARVRGAGVRRAMVAAGCSARRAGQGFYKRKDRRRVEILTLDPSTLEYRAQQPARLASLERRKSIDRRRRARRGAVPRQGQGRASSCARRSGRRWSTAARVAPRGRALADDVDRVMQWGFGWELGPFETCVASGSARADSRCRRRLRRRCAGPRRRTASGLLMSASRARERRRPEECRRKPRRPRRRRARGRVPLEDERDRRRHDPDAARRREGGVGELRGARRRQRRAELLGRRQPDAAAARSAGRQLGRGGPDGPRVPGRDDGAALRRRAGGRRAGRPGARRRLRNRAARRIACRRRRKPTSAWSRSASA